MTNFICSKNISWHVIFEWITVIRNDSDWDFLDFWKSLTTQSVAKANFRLTGLYFDLILTHDDLRVELFLMNTVVPSDVDPCLIKLSSISHFERKTRICTSSCGYILNIIILVMSYYLIVTWSSRDRKINWTKVFLTEINQRVRRKSCDIKMQKCYESCNRTGLRDSIK